MVFWCKFKTYYLVEAVDSSLQETDFKVKNTFDKKHYFSSNFGFTQMQIYCFSLMDAQI